MPCVAAGRFITIVLPGPARVLSLCEVQVMGYAGREAYPSPSLPSTVFSAGVFVLDCICICKGCVKASLPRASPPTC